MTSSHVGHLFVMLLCVMSQYHLVYLDICCPHPNWMKFWYKVVKTDMPKICHPSSISCWPVTSCLCCRGISSHSCWFFLRINPILQLSMSKYRCVCQNPQVGGAWNQIKSIDSVWQPSLSVFYCMLSYLLCFSSVAYRAFTYQHMGWLITVIMLKNFQVYKTM